MRGRLRPRQGRDHRAAADPARSPSRPGSRPPADNLSRPIAQHGANTVNIDGVDVNPRGWTLERRYDQKIGFALQSTDPGWYKMFSLVTPPDQWVFVAVAVDATGAMVLHTWDSLNGWRTEAPTGKVTPYVPAAATGQEGFLSVGASKGAPNREFTGQIDDVRVWSVAAARRPAGDPGRLPDHPRRHRAGPGGLLELRQPDVRRHVGARTSRRTRTT